MLDKIIKLLAYLFGKRAGVDQQREAEGEAFNRTALGIAEAEDHAPATRNDLVDRLRRSGL